jgi:hypothetical protein
MNSYGLRPFKNPIESWDFSRSTIQKRDFKKRKRGNYSDQSILFLIPL